MVMQNLQKKYREKIAGLSGECKETAKALGAERDLLFT
jgi:hypothetical protein